MIENTTGTNQGADTMTRNEIQNLNLSDTTKAGILSEIDEFGYIPSAREIAATVWHNSLTSNGRAVVYAQAKKRGAAGSINKVYHACLDIMIERMQG